MSKKNLSAKAVAVLGAAAISGLLVGTAQASTDISSSQMLLKYSSKVNQYAAAPDAGGTAADAKGAAAGDAAAADKHDCKGKNSCKGKGGCKSGDNSCKAKNSCKGKGGCNTMGATPAASPAAAAH